MDELKISQIAAAVAAQLGSRKMTLLRAKELIGRIEQKAKEKGMAVVIAVSDQAGLPIAVHCMDGAFSASYDIALNKTYTAAGLKMSTQKLGQLSQPGGSLYGIQYTNQGRIVIFGGGEPLYEAGEVIGALGVSGGSAEEDTALAAYGTEIFKEVIACL